MNDPIAILLVLGFIEKLMHPDYGVADFAWLFVRQIAIGGVVGLGVGYLFSFALREARLATAGLYPVATLASVALAFGIADTAHGSGFLAVYLTGLMLGSAAIPAKQTIAMFHEGMAWVAQLSMFLVLGLLIFPSDLGRRGLRGDGPGDRPGVRRAAAGDGRSRWRPSASRCASRRCSAGRACAARCPWCWRPSR